MNDTNDTSVNCIHQAFEARVRETPDALAVTCEGRSLSYGELNRRANQLARYLRTLGVGPETLVGVYLQRSCEMIICLFGIMKAGGAYVPLDSNYPKERLAFMLGDSRAPILLTDGQLLAQLPSHNASVIHLDIDRTSISQQSQENLSSIATQENAAYVAYTSGSTGHPKGVIITHGNLHNYIDSVRTALGITEEDLYLHTASFAFASSLRPLMVSLSRGASVLIATHEQIMNPLALFYLIKDKGATIFDVVASYLRTVTQSLTELPLDSRRSLLSNNLRLILSSGEPLSADIPRTWISEFNHSARLINMYGQTEVAGTIAVYLIPRPPNSGTKVVPIGYPLSNSQIYVLNAQLQVVPTGVVGEVYTGGPTVARGYLNQPWLTAEKFIPNPFDGVGNNRLFKTGDLGRYMSDGTLQVLGRADQQVKLRGLRIELGEIEAVLKEHPSVREAIVLAREGQNSDRQLLAYVVANPDRAPFIGGRKRYRLPNGMAIFQQNTNETDYLYQEIFVNKIYFKNGIRLTSDACVVDAGANIGMFTLFISRCFPDARIYAFEPIAPIFEALRNNAKLYGRNVKVFQSGIAERQRDEIFTYYPRHTMMSGLSAYANAGDELEVVKKYMRNAKHRGVEGMTEMLGQVDELLAGRFAEQSYLCHLNTLSDVIRENSIERIDLLKVDVQRAEMDVLNGIEGEDWNKINQIVAEVHDWGGSGSGGRIDSVVDLLQNHGYEIAVEQDELLAGTDRYTLYAIKQLDHRNGEIELETVDSLLLDDAKEPALLTVSELRDYLSQRLVSYMIPSSFIFLDDLPKTANGKIDRNALPTPGETALQVESIYTAPRTRQEEVIAGIWMEVLGVNRIGIHDNFFELGGHSLKATQVMSRTNSVFQIEVPVRTLFEAPTVSELATAVEERLIDELEEMSEHQANRLSNKF